MLDALPILSEPTEPRVHRRAAAAERVLLPQPVRAHRHPAGDGRAVFWLHVKRLARPRAAAARADDVGRDRRADSSRPWRGRVPMAPQANALLLPRAGAGRPLLRFLDPGRASHRRAADGAHRDGVAPSACVALPRLGARGSRAPAPRPWTKRSASGCLQCALDCPYGAITMVERDSRRSPLVARVDPELCVSCGICAGSCPPMGVGPPGRSGRDQLAQVRDFLAEPLRRPGEIVVVCCAHGAGHFASELKAAGGVPYPIDCAGNLHTSVIELLLRGGAGGVLVLACPPRDCWHREGAHWLERARVPRTRSRAAGARESRARQDRERGRRGSRSCGRGVADLCRGREGAGSAGC